LLLFFTFTQKKEPSTPVAIFNGLPFTLATAEKFRLVASTHGIITIGELFSVHGLSDQILFSKKISLLYDMDGFINIY
jgi:hypothetical protein